MELTLHVLRSVAGIALPFGFTFGSLVIFIWSIPLLMKLFKSVF